jgi:magnesium-transporting ATPase (P-type)
MQTEIGKIAAALKHQKSKVRPVKRNHQGKAGPHRYLQAWTLTGWDGFAHFLGINVGTPLQRKLSKLAILLFFIACICALIVEAANNFSSRNEVVIYGVATGLSMIPASLIVVLTITMAVGTRRMSKRNVLVRKLDSLEALGRKAKSELHVNRHLIPNRSRYQHLLGQDWHIDSRSNVSQSCLGARIRNFRSGRCI